MISDRCDYVIEQTDSDYRYIIARRNKLNSSFNWTEENKAHAKKLFAAVFELEDKMYDKMAALKKDYEQLISSKLTDYESFDIEGRIFIKRGIKYPFADKNQNCLIDYFSKFDSDIHIARASSEYEMRFKEDMFMRDLNWNIECFQIFLKENKDDPYIPYWFHLLWQDGQILSMEDLMVISPEDLEMEIRVDFN